MPEQTTPHAEDEPSTPPPAKAAARTRRRSVWRGVAWFALLAASAGALAAGHYAWRFARATLGSAQAELAEVRGTLHRMAGLGDEVAWLRQRLEAGEAAERQLRASLGELREALAETAAARPASAAQWRVAEAEYLLRVANHRLLMERDAAAARQLLALADNMLAELDDFALHEVRALLAEDMAALAAYRGADVQGVFLRLEALRSVLPDLPLRLPKFAGSVEKPPAPDKRPVPAAAPDSMWDALFARLGTLVRFRRQDVPAPRPLLPPVQAGYLEQHLLLSIDRAQLGALRREQAVFDASLGKAAEWIATHLDPNHEAVRRFAADVRALRQTALAADTPDLSRPLRRLVALRGGRAERPAAPTPAEAATAGPSTPPAVSTADEVPTPSEAMPAVGG